MAAPRPSVPESPKDFWSLVELLKDPEAYAERLRILEAARVEALRRIEQVAGAEEIDRLRIATAADRNMAGEELARAKEDAQRLRREAGEILTKARTDAQEMVRTARDTAERLRADTEQMRAAAESLDRRGQEALAQAARTVEEAQQMALTAERLREQSVTRLEQVRAILRQVQGVE